MELKVRLERSDSKEGRRGRERVVVPMMEIFPKILRYDMRPFNTAIEGNDMTPVWKTAANKLS